MPSYTVGRDIETVATVHATGDSVAKSSAKAEVREQLTAASADGIEDIDIGTVEIFEFPSGPFDPHRVTVALTVTVVVDASDETDATEAGADVIDEILSGTDLDDVEYVGAARVETAAN
ncbi:hypothetical protein [Halorientalis salina]|uniref:hypothetical protein n=1 Tax=Halorientalis salina TaxID=2932266 RepID=UPI0010AB8D3D|nr:hypothetical protein [Halorientalis salina]